MVITLHKFSVSEVYSQCDKSVQKRGNQRAPCVTNQSCMLVFSYHITQFVVRGHEENNDKAKVSHQVMSLRQKDASVESESEWPWALGAGPNVGSVAGAGDRVGGGSVYLMRDVDNAEEEVNEELNEMEKENKRLKDECAALKRSSAEWEKVAGRLAKLARVQVASGKE
jgi:hypothetical protein